MRRSIAVSLAAKVGSRNNLKKKASSLSLSSPSSRRSSSVTVVSFLSPCPEASRRASQRIAQWTGWKPVKNDEENHTNDNSSSSWNQVVLINNALFSYSQTWHSRALQCPLTGTVLHWISLQGNNANKNAVSSSLSTVSSAAAATAPHHHHQLLAIQQAENLMVARDFLTKTIQEQSSKTKIALNSVLGRPIQAKHLLSNGGGGLPLLQFVDHNESSTSTNNDNDLTTQSSSSYSLETRQFALKEIAISDHAIGESNNNMTLLQRLSNSTSLSRPVTGLYQLRSGGDGGAGGGVGGVCLRPLPTGRQDWQVSPPSLVFHVDSLESSIDLLFNNQKDNTNKDNDDDNQSVSITKIGYNGMSKTGQVMLRHYADLNGIDVRFCQATTYSSMFAEAQESLLAGSLQELQQSNHHHHDDTSTSANATTTTEQGKQAAGHCWAEFHANMKNPSGFIAKAKQGTMSKLRRAKPQDLPFE